MGVDPGMRLYEFSDDDGTLLDFTQYGLRSGSRLVCCSSILFIFYCLIFVFLSLCFFVVEFMVIKTTPLAYSK